MEATNLLENLPLDPSCEHFEDLVNRDGVRIERIVSYGQSSPDEGWYDQDNHEWILVLHGEGELEFEDGERVKLLAGDSLMIPAHRKHKVVGTAPDTATVWLAIFWTPPQPPKTSKL